MFRYAVLALLTAAQHLPARGRDVDSPMCVWSHRREGPTCAHACLAPMIGPCPRAIVTLFGRLQHGTCPPWARGEPMTVQAGPCGPIVFDVWHK